MHDAVFLDQTSEGREKEEIDIILSNDYIYLCKDLSKSVIIKILDVNEEVIANDDPNLAI